MKTVTAAGQAMEGSSASLTITSWVAVAVLPCSSNAVQITEFVPTERAEARHWSTRLRRNYRSGWRAQLNIGG